MASLSRTFLDDAGVRWGVDARLEGESGDAVPVAFTFTSQYGERRALDGPSDECTTWETFCDPDWRQLLAASRLVRPGLPHVQRRRRRGRS